jgi:N-sulfoglucosamine sulfohydrolase
MISYKKIIASIINQCIAYSTISLISISTAFALDAKFEQPNILWIVSEDNSPLLGAYGDNFATTPNIDKLAKQSIVYDNAFANSPVCAPTRFSIITGMHANAMGTGNMRSRNKIPAFVKTYTHYLRAANYHITNNSKTDYNFATADIPDGKLLGHKEWQAIDRQLWDKGSYTDRQEGQPFFHVYNISESHESRLHRPLKNRQHRPEDVPLPPYHPDTVEIRNDWALYYDRITQMDSIVGKKMA